MYDFFFFLPHVNTRFSGWLMVLDFKRGLTWKQSIKSLFCCNRACRRAPEWVRQLLPLRLPRVHEEPGALPDHGGAHRDQRQQVRTHPGLPAVQSGFRARVRLTLRVCFYLTRACRLPVSAAFSTGVPSEPKWTSLPTESQRAFILARLGTCLPSAARTGPSPLHELHEPLTQLAHNATHCFVDWLFVGFVVCV